jgi:transposase
MTGLAEILDANARLREEVALLRGELSQARTTLAERDAMLAEVQRRAEALARHLALEQLKRGGPASQRYVAPEQDPLPFPGVTAPPRAPQPEPQSDDEATEPTKGPRAGKKPRRRNRDDFQNLPAQTVTCPAADAPCAKCGGPLSVIGQARSFRIEWVPGRFVVHDVVRDKCACARCPDQGVLTAAGPYALDRSLAGNGLVARVLVDKFADHIPANRQARRMAREGFDVGSHTLSAWIGAAGGLLGRVADAVRADLLAGNVLQGDDTGMPVQDGEDGHLRKGRMWAFTDQQQVFYAFTDTKEGKFPNALLDGFAGKLLLVDGGSEFNEVIRSRGLERAGCWSHLRSYFFDARHHHPGEADLALGTLKDLFLIERDLWGRPPDEVLAGRAARSQPLVDGFFEWTQALSRTVRPDSALGDAVRYANNQQAALRTFLTRGDVPMHNNLSELMLRQTVVGRKNWLFARSEGGARAAATLYTLVGSCFLQEVDPWFYLRDLLDRLPDYPAPRVGDLTPRQWKQANPGHPTALT